MPSESGERRIVSDTGPLISLESFLMDIGLFVYCTTAF
jgi:hypothetical protein